MGQDRIPVPGMIYRHSDKAYQVIALANHSQTNEKMVVYQKMYDDFSIYVKPYDMFMGEFFGNVIEEIDDVKDCKVENSNIAVDDDIKGCNPDLLAFLEADTYEDKRNILVNIRKRIDDRLINDLAASLDVTVDDGDLDVRYRSLMNCLDTMTKFECNRLR